MKPPGIIKMKIGLCPRNNFFIIPVSTRPPPTCAGPMVPKDRSLDWFADVLGSRHFMTNDFSIRCMEHHWNTSLWSVETSASCSWLLLKLGVLTGNKFHEKMFQTNLVDDDWHQQFVALQVSQPPPLMNVGSWKVPKSMQRPIFWLGG